MAAARPLSQRPQVLARHAAHLQQRQPGLRADSTGGQLFPPVCPRSHSQSLESADLGARTAQQGAQRSHGHSHC